MWPSKREGKAERRTVGTYRCPKCNSKNIKQELALSGYIIIGRSLVYHCHDCEYRGIIVYNDFDGSLDDTGDQKDDGEPTSEK